MKKIALILCLMGTLFFGFGTAASHAAEVDVLINKLVEKGLLTKEEATQLLNQMQKEEVRQENTIKQTAEKAAKETVQKEAKSGGWDKVPSWVNRIHFKGDFRLRYQYQDIDLEMNRDRSGSKQGPLPLAIRSRGRRDQRQKMAGGFWPCFRQRRSSIHQPDLYKRFRDTRCPYRLRLCPVPAFRMAESHRRTDEEPHFHGKGPDVGQRHSSSGRGRPHQLRLERQRHFFPELRPFSCLMNTTTLSRVTPSWSFFSPVFP